MFLAAGGKTQPGNPGGGIDLGGGVRVSFSSRPSMSLTEAGGKAAISWQSLWRGDRGPRQDGVPHGRHRYFRRHGADRGAVCARRSGSCPSATASPWARKAAALACKRYFKFDIVVPIHYGTFPIIDHRPSEIHRPNGQGRMSLSPKSASRSQSRAARLPWRPSAAIPLAAILGMRMAAAETEVSTFVHPLERSCSPHCNYGCRFANLFTAPKMACQDQMHRKMPERAMQKRHFERKRGASWLKISASRYLHNI